MEKIRTLIYIIIQCTWGVIQTVIGLALFIILKNCKHEFFRGSIKTLNKRFNVSLGMFIFVSDENEAGTSGRLTVHEYGHTIQSLLLGPFYLLVIGLPSITWCCLPFFKKMRILKKLPYSSFWVESWADKLGEKFVSLESVQGIQAGIKRRSGDI